MIDYLIPAPIITPAEARLINPLVLAFVGDAVQTLYVRSRLAADSDAKSGVLHKRASAEISACAQADEAMALLPLLTEEETAVYKRARNSKTGRRAKNAAVTDYRKASGLEAVFGYLYMIGDGERLALLLKAASDKESL